MLRGILVLCVWALSLSKSSSQPVQCTETTDCSTGYYCVKEANICRECLSCKDLKREPPSKPSDCIESVADCGACFKGLVLDRLGDVNAACVESSAEESQGTPHYVWGLIGICALIFLAVMAGIIVYLSLNSGVFDHFKIGGNCQSGTVSTNIRAETRASAPEAPPPYSPQQYTDIPYSSVRSTESPCPPQHLDRDQRDVHLEEEGPFIKRTPAPRPTDARESAANQAARVYNLPNYERHELPPSPESPIVTELNDNLDIHDEETMESPWSPNGPSNGNVNTNVSQSSAGGAESASASASLPAMLAAARDSSLVEHTPPKQMCIRPNTSNRNRDSNSGSGDSQGNFSGSQSGPPYNFITQITNVVQFNRST